MTAKKNITPERREDLPPVDLDAIARCGMGAPRWVGDVLDELEGQNMCLFCDARYGDGTEDGYHYHELYTCGPCWDRIGWDELDAIAHELARSDRRGRLLPEHVRQAVVAKAVRKYYQARGTT
jgi:hypothetical protein